MKSLDLNQMEKLHAGDCESSAGWGMFSIFVATAGFVAVGVLTAGVGVVAGAAYLASVSATTAGVAAACS